MVVHEGAIKNIACIRIAHFEDVNPVVYPVGYGTARHGEHRFKLTFNKSILEAFCMSSTIRKSQSRARTLWIEMSISRLPTSDNNILLLRTTVSSVSTFRVTSSKAFARFRHCQVALPLNFAQSSMGAEDWMINAASSGTR